MEVLPSLLIVAFLTRDGEGALTTQPFVDRLNSTRGLSRCCFPVKTRDSSDENFLRWDEVFEDDSEGLSR